MPTSELHSPLRAPHRVHLGTLVQGVGLEQSILAETWPWPAHPEMRDGTWCEDSSLLPWVLPPSQEYMHFLSRVSWSDCHSLHGLSQSLE